MALQPDDQAVREDRHRTVEIGALDLHVRLLELAERRQVRVIRVAGRA
jgi:hypothetical protein